MASRNKNQVTLTFAGDSAQLEKSTARVDAAFSEVGSAADEMSKEVGSASKRMGDEIGGASRRMSSELRDTSLSFDRTAEATDALDTRAMGFRDTVTGVQDSVLGLSDVLRGDLSADALVTAGAGVGDLASGATNLLVPAFKNAVTSAKNAAVAVQGWAAANRGLLLSFGAVGVALAAATAALLIFRKEEDEVEVSTDNLVADLERFAATGRVTGEIMKVLGDDTLGNLRSILDDMNPAIRENRNLWEKFLDLRASQGSWNEETTKMRKNLEELDEGMAEFVKTGGDGQQVMEDLAAEYGFTDQELEHIIEAMPKYRQELKRAESEQIDATEAIRNHTDSLKEYTDALKEHTDPVFAFVQAQQDVQEAQKAVTEAEEEFGANSSEWEEATRDLTQAKLGLMGAASGAAEAADSDLIPALRQLKDDGFLTRDEFRLMVEDIQEAKGAFDDFDGTRVRTQTDHHVTFHYGSRGEIPQGFGPQRRQHGGPTAPLMLVGEEGPELISGQQVMAHQQSMSELRQMADSNGGRGGETVVKVERGDGGTSTDLALADMVLSLVRTGALSLTVDGEGQVVAGG